MHVYLRIGIVNIKEVILPIVLRRMVFIINILHTAMKNSSNNVQSIRIRMFSIKMKIS